MERTPRFGILLETHGKKRFKAWTLNMNHLIHNRSQYVNVRTGTVYACMRYACVRVGVHNRKIVYMYRWEWKMEKGRRGERERDGEKSRSLFIHVHINTSTHISNFSMQWRCDGRVYYNSYARCLFIPCSFVLTFIGTTRLRISYLSLLLGFPHSLARSFAVSMIVLSFHSLVAFVLNSQEIVIIRNDSINIFNLINVCITYVFFSICKNEIFSKHNAHTFTMVRGSLFCCTWKIFKCSHIYKHLQQNALVYSILRDIFLDISHKLLTLSMTTISRKLKSTQVSILKLEGWK